MDAVRPLGGDAAFGGDDVTISLVPVPSLASLDNDNGNRDEQRGGLNVGTLLVVVKGHVSIGHCAVT